MLGVLNIAQVGFWHKASGLRFIFLNANCVGFML